MRSCDLMFAAAAGGLIDQAVIAFDEPVEAEWPLDELNEALAAFYTSTLAAPWLTVVNDLKGPIGYVVLPRSERRDDHEDVFWTCLAEGEVAHAGRKEFLVDLPRWHATPHDPDVGRDPCAAVAYAAPWGPPLPVGPINDAIQLMLRQADWPESGAVYLYPVRRGSDPSYSGLLLADSVDGLGDDALVDDAMFRNVRSTHDPKKRKRYDW